VECEAQAAPSSEALARSAQGGDSRALALLIARHKHEAYRIALRLVGRPYDAEELLQNALERFIKHLRRYDPGRPFRPWLLRIVVNQARTYWRARKLKAWIFGQPEEASTHSSPHHDLWRKELRHTLAEGLGRLPADQREAFVLKHVEGLSYEEMAYITGDSTGALRVRVHRARLAMLDWCRAHGVTVGGAVGNNR
jgi:RNA polymerase sigma-70 factor (ECF subfamily)